MHVCIDVITANIRTEIVEGKSNHAIFWKWDGPSALLSDRSRNTNGQTGRGCPTSMIFADGRRISCKGDPRLRRAQSSRGRPLVLHST